MQAAQLRTARILWAAIGMSVMTLGVVLQLAVPEGPPASVPIPTLTAEMLGLGLALASFIVPVITRRQREQILRASRGNEAQARASAGAQYRTNLILRLALAEGVGVIGFMQAFTSHVPAHAWPFLAGSLAVIAWNFPTARRMFAPS